MNKLKKLALSSLLLCALVGAAFGTETNPPLCAPGETHSPPCMSQSDNDDLITPGETSGPPASDTVAITDLAETVLWSLLLF